MAFNLKEYEHFNSSQFRFGNTGATYNGASHEYMDIPKSRFCFVLHFEISDLAKQMIQQMYGTSINLGELTAFMIKDVDKPAFSIDTVEMNQYNRTRLHQGKIKYSSVNMTIYDTISSYCSLLVDAYLRFYYGDFSDKTLNSWRYNNVSSKKNFEESFSLSNLFSSYTKQQDSTDSNSSDYTWGRSIYNQGDQDLGYFFKRIDIYEIDGNTYTVYNLHNPVIESIQYDNKSHEGGEPATIKISWKYEGISNICPVTNNRAISATTAQIAKTLSLSDDGEFSPYGFFKYWGEMDSADISEYDPTQIAGFPSQNSSGLDFSTATSTVNSILKIGTSATAVYNAVSSGNITDIINNTKNAMGEGNATSTGLGVLGAGMGSISKIGGLF